MSVSVIIVAAGSGSRYGANLPKQFCLLGDWPVLMHTIRSVRKAIPQSSIYLVLNSNFLKYWSKLCTDFNFTSPTVIEGGDSRWQSVKNALSFIHNTTDNAANDHIILVHDGARPIVSTEMVNRLLKPFSTNPAPAGIIPVIPVTDSLRELHPSGSSFPVDRSRFVAVQTPQAFKAPSLFEAYEAPYSTTFTDDASVVSAKFGEQSILLTQGDTYNIKITNPGDIEIAALYLRKAST